MDLDDDVLNQFTAASNHSEMLSTNPMYYDDVAEIIPYEDYDHSRAKHRASILWLIAKANDNGKVPAEFSNPFYRDNQGQELLKPWITQRMASAELYGRALANIYGVPDYSSFSHQNILQLLTRRGVFNDQIGIHDLGERITETMLLKNCPIKLAAHLIIIECLMMLYTREILIPVKVMEVTSRFSGEEDDAIYTELPPSTEPEDVALYWVNRACAQLNEEISRDHLMKQEDQHPSDPSNALLVPSLDELSDMCDGCSLFALLAFYCPEHVDWREICLKQDISIADSIYNLQRIQYFCQELFPSDICFLSLEDFLYLPEPIVPNFLAFIADLLFMFEVQPVDAVTPPYLRLYPELYQDECDYEGKKTIGYQQMLTPSEMKAKSLKSTWNDTSDSMETSLAESNSNEYPSNYPLYNRPTYNQRTNSNLTLNQFQPNTSFDGSSRRNSLVHNKNHRRSSLVSNGNEILNHNHNLNEKSSESEAVYAEPNEIYDTNANVSQLSSYFSSITVNQDGQHYNQSTRNIVNDGNEYVKNRSRASGSCLTDYFSSLSNINEPTNQSSATHVRAQRHHPNNIDNVKQLLSQREESNNYSDNLTNSSDTSSVAEISEFSEQIRAQLKEKRRQIETDRKNEKQKRFSLDHNFRQEILKTLKNIDNAQHESAASDRKIPMNADDEKDSYEIHELNPIRNEKTFVSIPSSTTNKSSTFVRKNLFSASEDLKSSMIDLNYANAKDLNEKNRETRDFDLKISKSESTSVPATEVQQPNDNSKLSEKGSDSATETINESGSIPPSTGANVQHPPLSLPSPSRRSQWGEPMIPLAGQIPAGLFPSKTHSSPIYPQPPPWSQNSMLNNNYENQNSQKWYNNVQPPYPMSVPPNQSYPYGFGPLPPPPQSVPFYDPYSVSHVPIGQEHQMSPMTYHHPHAVMYPNVAIPAPQNSANYQVTATAMTNINRIEQNDSEINNYSAEKIIISGEKNTEIEDKNDDSKTHHQSETFFISFDKQNVAQKKHEHHPKANVESNKQSEAHSDHRNLIRTATQTLVSADRQIDERIKELYNVRRPANPPVPAVSFVIDGDLKDEEDESTAKDSLEDERMKFSSSKDNSESFKTSKHSTSLSIDKSEEEMAKKKEAIMKQSLKRRAEQESRRVQKEQELAVKREQERMKREQMDRKKEEEKEKRAFILDQHKRRKQLAEEIEKNGGSAMLQGNVHRSSSTLILNRSSGSSQQLSQSQQSTVLMRNRGSINHQRPRPKSLHSALINECQNLSTISGSSSRLSSSRDELDDLISSGRLFSSPSTTGSRPQSSIDNQISSTPIGDSSTGSFMDSTFASTSGGLIGDSSTTSGPVSSNFYQEYNGPKLFVKPSQKSNKTLILNAINVVLAGTVNADTNRRVTEVINKCDSKYFLILFRNSGLQYRAIYSYNPEREEVIKLDGVGPKNVNNEMIDKFFKYNSGTKSFAAIQTKHLCVTIDAFTIHNHLWMNKARQMFQVNTPRRFMP
ncbi:hypothetical protein NH340_JMT08461 [Sarcoptes scabiei]|nr:hypothetical protein NH340_JMT08461 [Sarcoptes scabiei]